MSFFTRARFNAGVAAAEDALYRGESPPPKSPRLSPQPQDNLSQPQPPDPDDRVMPDDESSGDDNEGQDSDGIEPVAVDDSNESSADDSDGPNISIWDLDLSSIHEATDDDEPGSDVERDEDNAPKLTLLQSLQEWFITCRDISFRAFQRLLIIL
jgi:hypothetical protein